MPTSKVAKSVLGEVGKGENVERGGNEVVGIFPGEARGRLWVTEGIRKAEEKTDVEEAPPDNGGVDC